MFFINPWPWYELAKNIPPSDPKDSIKEMWFIIISIVILIASFAGVNYIAGKVIGWDNPKFFAYYSLIFFPTLFVDIFLIIYVGGKILK